MTPPPVGLLAGRGVYPKYLFDNIAKTGAPVVVAGLAGQTAHAYFRGARAFETFPLGALVETARFFIGNNVDTIYFAGGIDRKTAWRYCRPDPIGWGLLLIALARGDDRLLRKTARVYETLGISVGDPSPFTEEMLASKGHLGGPVPDRAAIADLTVAWRAAKSHGAADKGQAAVARNGSVVAREGRFGTDHLINTCSVGGGVLVKAVKPGQDRRFDLPAIGPDTMVACKRRGIIAIGIEAEGVLILEKERVLSLSDALAVSLVGL